MIPKQWSRHWLERHAHQVLAEIPQPIAVLDADAQLVFGNRALCELLGYSALGELPARLPIGPPSEGDDTAMLQQTIGDVAPNALVVREIECWCSDGTIVPVRISLRGIQFGRPASNHFLCSFAVLQEAPRHHHEIYERRIQLAVEERLSSLSELTTSIAHELNQPLAAITLYAQLSLHQLKLGKRGQKPLEDSLGKLVEQALRAGAVSQSAQNVVSRTPGVSETVDLNAVLRQVEPVARIEANGCGVRLGFNLTPDLPPVRVCVRNIQLVTLNLIRNAIQACSTTVREGHKRHEEEGGRLGADHRVEVHSAVRITPTMRLLEVAVTDNGPGIDPDLSPVLFSPLEKIPDKTVGLGLATCRTLLAEEQGTLEYNNLDAGGCTFRYRLPEAAIG